MDNVKIEFSPLEYIEIEFNNQKISVLPYIDIILKAKIAKEYLHNFYEIDETLERRILIAEYAFIAQIITECTNIETDGLDIDSVIRSGLWDLINKTIKNCDETKWEIDDILYHKKSEISLENTIQRFLDGILDFLNKMSEMDVDSLKNTADEFIEKLSKLNNDIPGLLNSNAKVVRPNVIEKIKAE